MSVGDLLRIAHLRGTASAVTVPLAVPAKTPTQVAFGAGSDAFVVAYSDGSLELRRCA